ncbi:MAG: WhiB family transcriptional regulator [Actinomycetota bacterium]
MTIIEQWNETELRERTDISFDLPVMEVSATPVTIGEDQTDKDWETLAACRTVDGAAELFFSEELPDIVAAKRICAECPVIAPCLEGAIERAEPCGVWGGQLFANGRILTQKRRRGRPPKVARPEDQLPVVPVPAHLQKLIA